MKNCLECNSEKIVTNVKMNESVTQFLLEVYGEPNAIFFRDKISSKIRADVCSNCGFIAYYATDLSELKRIYEIQQERYNSENTKENEKL